MSRADPAVAATETEIESAEKKIDDYECNEALVKHIIQLIRKHQNFDS